MPRRVLWVVAVLLAAMALVAGCFAPSKPLVVIGDSGYQRQPSAADQERVGKMDQGQLQNEVLRLTAENDRLRQDNAKLDRDNKKLKGEKKSLEGEVDDLKDQVKDLKKRR
jgi:peptidoglycan hydrolase CwlO-like protein